MEAKEEDTTATTRQRDSNCADEIYEHMSTTAEDFQHYKQVKKIYVFPSMNSLNSIGSNGNSKEQSFDENVAAEARDDIYDVPPRAAPISQEQQQKQQGNINVGEVDDDEDNYEVMEESISAPQSNENSFKGLLYY